MLHLSNAVLTFVEVVGPYFGYVPHDNVVFVFSDSNLACMFQVDSFGLMLMLEVMSRL